MKFEWNHNKYNVTVKRTLYKDGSLHVYLLDESGKYFLSLSSDIYYSKYEASTFAYVDLFSIPQADRFIVKNKIGKSTGITRVEGRRKFYLYQFNLDMIESKDLE